MVASRTQPNLVARMQQHLTAFDFCLQAGDYAGCKLKAMQMNMDLEPDMQVTVGHGINRATVPKDAKTSNDFARASLLDDSCDLCKSSNQVHDMHTPPELDDARSKNNKIAIEMQWLTEYILLVESQIRILGYRKGWWNE